MADLRWEFAHLAQVNARIAAGELRVAKLEQLASMFGRGGGDPLLGRQTLRITKEVLVTLRASRELILDTLDDIGAGR